jgi:hypothetical protein
MDITQPFETVPPGPLSSNGNHALQDPTAALPLDGAEPAWDVGRYARQDLDRETTRYLSAATQLDVNYAQKVVGKVVGEPFRALAPAYGADVTVVTRWAVDSVLRRWRRDRNLVATLVSGILLGALLVWLSPSWPLAVLSALVAMMLSAWIIVSIERWMRIYGIVVSKLLRSNFDPQHAPAPRYQWVRERIDAVSARRRGNLVVFRGNTAFIGSGLKLSREHVVIDVSRGRSVKNGKPQKPQKFTNADVHTALVSAMKKIGFADIHVEERLFVNGRHIKGNDALLSNGKAAPPADCVPEGMLRHAVLHPTPDARVYVCVEMPGWQGQLVVTLFARAVHAGGSLYIEWEYYVLPPLSAEFLSIDQLYGKSQFTQVRNACAWGARRFFPAFCRAPFVMVHDLRRMISAKRRQGIQERAIEQGQEFNYGASRSIREAASGESRHHYFLARDEIMYVLMSQQILVREVRAFLRKREVSLGEFDIQVQEITKETFNFYNVHLGNVTDSAVVIGDKSRAKNAKS